MQERPAVKVLARMSAFFRLDFSPRVWKGGALQAAEKPVGTVILRSPRRRSLSHCLENTQSESLRVVYPERQSEILRCAQNDSERAQDDSI